MTNSEQVQRALADTWQKIPEEERNLLLAQAKAQGAEACCVCALAGCSLAVGLHATWIALATLAFLPLLYQVVSTRTWLEIKPITTIRYFLAGATSKLYAQTLNSKEPTLKMIFRGSLETVTPQDDSKVDQEFAQELQEEKTPPKDVWISLFPDSLIMISEGYDGAVLEFGHSILENFKAALDVPEGSQDNASPSRLFIQTTSQDNTESHWVLSCPHATTLLACERKIRYFNHKSVEHPS